MLPKGKSRILPERPPQKRPKENFPISSSPLQGVEKGKKGKRRNEGKKKKIIGVGIPRSIHGI